MGSGSGLIVNSSFSGLDFLSNIKGSGNIITWIVIFIIFLWIVIIVWTARDINFRTNNTFLQIISIFFVTIFTPIIGLPLYFIMRPVQYNRDRIPRREACATNLVVCYNCKTLNPKEYNCCINCGEQLKIKCKECENLYPHNYHYCNVCGAPNIEVYD